MAVGIPAGALGWLPVQLAPGEELGSLRSCQLSRPAVERGQRESQKGTLLPLPQITLPFMPEL